MLKIILTIFLTLILFPPKYKIRNNIKIIIYLIGIIFIFNNIEGFGTGIDGEALRNIASLYNNADGTLIVKNLKATGNIEIGKTKLFHNDNRFHIHNTENKGINLSDHLYVDRINNSNYSFWVDSDGIATNNNIRAYNWGNGGEIYSVGGKIWTCGNDPANGNVAKCATSVELNGQLGKITATGDIKASGNITTTKNITANGNIITVPGRIEGKVVKGHARLESNQINDCTWTWYVDPTGVHTRASPGFRLFPGCPPK